MTSKEHQPELMIAIDSLATGLAAVEKAWDVFDGLGKQKQAASEKEKHNLMGPLQAAERDYFVECSRLAVTVAHQVKVAKGIC
jgi:hypothetical protein